MQENILSGWEAENKKLDKEEIWKQKMKELNDAGDALGLGIDERIKEVVGAFNVHDFNTNQSCEGHADRGFGAPWISVEAPNGPEERFVNEKNIFEEIAKKYGVSYEDVRRANNHEAWVEALKLSSQNEETQEFKTWRKASEKLRERLSEFVKEFYQNRKSDIPVRLEVEEVDGQGVFRIHNGGEDYDFTEKMSEEQKNGLDGRISQYREEMHAFGKFLKNKFLESDN